MAEYYGDLVFVNSHGMCFGGIYFTDNAGVTTLNSIAKVQVTDFDANSVYNNMTPDHLNDHVTITKAGIYKLSVGISVANQAAQSHVLIVSVWKNDGGTEFANTRIRRSLTGGSGDIGSLSINGIIDLAVDDTIEIWALTDSANDRSVIFVNCSLSLLQIGGT